VYLFVAITLIFATRLKYSSYGRSLLSIREDEIAAQAVGVNTTRYKVRAFVLSSFFAGLAGALFALQLGSINAGDLGFQRSFEILIMVVLGGLGSISGSTIAAIILTVLPEMLRQVDRYRMIVYALLLIVMMIVRPQGLFGVREAWNLFRRRRRA
jgi:branched-chain amino acid transport system permease protein